MTFDCDDMEAAADALLFHLPPYNWLTLTDHGAHATWCIHPVHRYPEARSKPQELLARISEYYRHALGADPGYTGALTRNPVCHETWWWWQAPYSLDHLSKAIPSTWTPPRISQTGIGRHCDLFQRVMKWAGYQSNLETPVLDQARVFNTRFDHPLSLRDLQSTAKVIERYRARWAVNGWHDAHPKAHNRFRSRQAARGRRSGEARREQTIYRDALVELDRVVYKLSERQIAAKRGLSKTMVHKILKRAQKTM